MNHMKQRLTAFLDSGAWLLIAIGLVLFVSRIPLASVGFVNFPLAVTIMQTAGLMFTIAGVQILISMLVWPGISFTELTNAAIKDRDPAPALVLFGLFAYNGLSTVAFVLWLSSAMGAGLGA